VKYVFKLVAAAAAASVGAGCLVEVEQAPGDWSEVGDAEAERASLITYNLITYNLITYNSLSANVRSSTEIVQHPLDDKTYSGGNEYLQLQLLDPDAQLYFGYLVSCALDETQVVPWVSPDGKQSEEFFGAMGLCPEWGSGKPSLRCQELVSACILARNNAFGVRVAQSPRGINSRGLPISNPSDPVPALDEDEARSFHSCGSAEYSVARDCGFEPDFAGRCSGGSDVKLAGTGCSGGVAVRVCPTRNGCDQATSIEQTDEICGESIAFTCPASGEFSVMQGPTYTDRPETATIVSVAGAAYPATEEELFDMREGAFFGNIFGGNVDENVRVEVLEVGDEFEIVHRWRGKPFKNADDLANSYEGTLYTHMYACHSDEWTHGEAYLRQRLCAGISHAGCAAKPMGACYVPPVQSNASPGLPGPVSLPSWFPGLPDAPRVPQLPSGSRARLPSFPAPRVPRVPRFPQFPGLPEIPPDEGEDAGRCEVQDNTLLMDDLDYDKCHAGGRVWEHPITVFLEHRCAVASDFVECFSRDDDEEEERREKPDEPWKKQ